MFIAIFNYIEHLYGKIKPKKLFFMAIDGVAPRAKMNQQRARRFRTALDAEQAKEKAISQGVEMPKEDAFDSMEYIRRSKAQPDYDSNLRHCLYGLDADLIMLGLLSHDPHFCLLREEVTFGRQVQKKPKELEHQNFYLLHICMVREYLELEFQELEQEGILGFHFDM